MSFQPAIVIPELNVSTASSVVGSTTTAKTLLGSVVIKGGQMEANDILIVVSYWFVTNSGGTKTIDIDWGATNIITLAASGQSGGGTMGVIHNRNSLTSQICGTTGTGVYGTSASAYVTASENTASNVTLSFFGTVATANADTITLENFTPYILKPGM